MLTPQFEAALEIKESVQSVAGLLNQVIECLGYLVDQEQVRNALLVVHSTLPNDTKLALIESLDDGRSALSLLQKLCKRNCV